MSDKHSENCKVCQFGADEIDWTLSNRVIGDIVDCAESSVRRHKKWASVNGVALDTDLKVLPEDESPGPYYKPRRAWQGPNGEMLRSWEYVGPDASEEFEWDYSTLDEVFSSIPEPTIENPEGPEEVLVLADPQIGKAGEAGGGTKETIERVRTSVSNAIERYKVNRPSVLYLVDGGDPIENCFNTGSQIGTNDLSLPDQVLTYTRLMVDVIARLTPYVDKVVYVTVTSNHGEARNAPGNNPYGSENDWGLHIQQVIRDRLGDQIEYVRPDANEDTAVFTCNNGTRVAVNHGHHSGTQAKLKSWLEKQIVGRRPGWDADLAIFGHYHNDGYFRFGRGQVAFSAPAIDPGSAWFTRKSGESCPPGMLAFRVQDSGRWSDLSVL